MENRCKMAAAVVMSCYVLRHTQSLSIRISIATTNILSVSTKVFWLHFSYFIFVNKQMIQSGQIHNHACRDLIRSVFCYYLVLTLLVCRLMFSHQTSVPPSSAASPKRYERNCSWKTTMTKTSSVSQVIILRIIIYHFSLTEKM